jgi:1A family penicillin-binding protein
MKLLQPKSFFNSFITNYIREFIIIIAAIGVLIIAAPIITQQKYADDIKSKENIVSKKNNGVVLIDRNGKQFFSFYDGHFREYIPLSKVSKPVQQSVLVAEDEHFYEHNGVSVQAISGAVAANFRKGDMAYGGSTITQQLVKNTLLENKRNLFRKYEEVVMAQEIEERYTKEEILEMYLNSVYFGEGAYGIEEASRTYFNKNASQLDVNEASMLAGIITAPSSLSPVSGDKQKARQRQMSVLSEMVEDRYITEQQKQEALQKQLVYVNGREQELYKAPHFALLVKQQLIEKYGEKELMSSGMKVYTTLDLAWQFQAEEAVRKQVANLAYNNGTNAGVVVMNPKNGEVQALVGSASWSNDTFGKVNMAVTPRQPGSAFKPIVFLAGFESQKVTPATILMDSPKTFAKNYRPKNYDNKFRGPVSARYALSNSLNVPSVELQTKVGVDSSLSMAKRLGINSLGRVSDYGPSLVLGTGEVQLLELTNAYATFANNGKKHEPTFITRIEDRHGKTMYQNQIEGEQVVDSKYVFLISSILSDNETRRDVFGSALDISRPAAVKTGTTENYRDAWTVGYTPDLTIGVWVGNNNNATMDTVAGSLGAAPIWKELMDEFTAGTPIAKFEKPSGVVATSVCADNRRRGFRGNSVDTEYFIIGTEQKACERSDGSRFASVEDVDSFLKNFMRANPVNSETPRVGAAGDAPQDAAQLTPVPTSSPAEQSPLEDSSEKEDKPGNGNGRGRENDD